MRAARALFSLCHVLSSLSTSSAELSHALAPAFAVQVPRGVGRRTVGALRGGTAAAGQWRRRGPGTEAGALSMRGGGPILDASSPMDPRPPQGAKRFAPAAERNTSPILAVMHAPDAGGRGVV